MRRRPASGRTPRRSSASRGCPPIASRRWSTQAWSAVRAERPSVALAATLHDATGVLAHDIRRLLPRLRGIYAAIAVTTSPPTAAPVVSVLRVAGVHAGSPRAPTPAP